MLALDNMKKKYLLLLIISISFFSINAQNFGGGLIVGLSSSQVNGDDLGGFNKAGGVIGVFANKLIYSSINFQMEMNFIMKGSDNKNMTKIEHKDYNRPDISLSYIEIPLLLQYQQNNLLDFEGGVLFGYLINGYYNDLDGKLNSNISPFIKYDIGILLGLTYKYTDKIHFNTRISSSIIPIGQEDYDNISSYSISRKGKYNSVLSLSIHYNI